MIFYLPGIFGDTRISIFDQAYAMNLNENIKIALRALKSNFLRTALTLMIIAVGITCLVGILTAIDSILFSMSDSFTRLGANSFNVRPLRENIQSRSGGRQTKRAEPLVYNQVMAFKENYKFGSSKVTVEAFCTSNAEVSFMEKKTNPTVVIRGVDENFFDVSNYNLEVGRKFTAKEVKGANNKCILGMDLVDQLFDGKPERALNKVISINALRYKVIGVLEKRGSSFDGDSDRRIFITITQAKQIYGFPDKNYNLAIGLATANEIDPAINAAMIPLRKIRKLKASEKNDFEIRKSDSILNTLKDMTFALRIGTIAIALMTLLGASIGLMNIMLVTVTERTREIGVSKAVGAKRRNILAQFLTEAIVITQIGGIVGVLLGVVVGNSVSMMIGSPFLIPWAWIILAFIVCFFVGIVSGLYPALKASRLDPIESLRYE